MNYVDDIMDKSYTLIDTLILEILNNLNDSSDEQLETYIIKLYDVFSDYMSENFELDESIKDDIADKYDIIYEDYSTDKDFWDEVAYDVVSSSLYDNIPIAVNSAISVFEENLYSYLEQYTKSAINDSIEDILS